MASNLDERTPLPQTTLNEIRAINTWQAQRIQLVQRVVQAALENLIATSHANIGELSNDLDRRLMEEIFPDVDQLSDITYTRSNTEGQEDGGYAEDDVESSSSFSDVPRQLWPSSESCQLSSSWASENVDGQGLIIKKTPSSTYRCYKDSNNGVMAFNGNELVYIDWILQRDASGNNEIRVAAVPRVGQLQSSLRSIPFPHNLENMRVVDIDYVPFMSAYVFAVVTRQPAMDRRSFLYSFDSRDDSFEQWTAFTDTNNGLITRICCCSSKSLIYLIVNMFGENRLIMLDQSGQVRIRKSPADLPLPIENARLVDVACTTNNDQLALAFNTSTMDMQGRIGVCLTDPKTWTRIATVNLGSAQAPYTVPRLTWLNKENMFAAVNHENDQLITFNTEGQVVGWRSFYYFVQEYEEPNLRPINICAPHSSESIAVRYTRFINIHRVNS